jgi:hypothetical protein
MKRTDREAALGTLVALGNAPVNDPDRFTFKSMIVFRKARVLSELRATISNPLDASKVLHELIAEGFVTPDRYATKNVDEGRKTFRVNHIAVAVCRARLAPEA